MHILARHTSARLALAVFALALIACGSTPPHETVPTPTPPPTPPPTMEARIAALASLTAATPDELTAFVEAHAKDRLHEVQPDFDVAQLDAYRATPDSAPGITGRAVERLMDLAVVALVRGDLDAAEQTIRLVRAKANNRNSAWAANTLLCEIARRRAGADDAAAETAIAAVLRELPKTRFGAATVVFQIVQTEAQVDAELEQTRAQLLSLETASDVIFTDQVLRQIVRHRDRFLHAIDTVRAENDAHPDPAAHDFHTIDLARERRTSDVVVGVWDTGTAVDMFPRQLYTVAHETANGQDDDGDGLVDDLHGIVADGDAPNTALVYDPTEPVITEYAPFLRGIMDLRAGMASTPAAQRVLELERGVTDVDALKALEKNLDAVGEWAHGTHVAGILLFQNPRARLVAFRSAWAGEARPYYERGPTDDELAKERQNMEAIAAFINANHVRVVNASLGFSTDYLEDQLRHETSVYGSDDAVRARARAVQARRKDNWTYVIHHCPDTLFVVAAGNSNRDVLEYDDIPASIDAPNLLVVGAVNRFGEWATFTNSSPERVRVFGYGVEVDSVIPNGQHVPLSGTSMASPFVANTAAKMFAVYPALTPADAIRVIAETGDAIPAPFNGVIANQRAAIDGTRRVAAGPAHGNRPALPAEQVHSHPVQ